MSREIGKHNRSQIVDAPVVDIKLRLYSKIKYYLVHAMR